MNRDATVERQECSYFRQISTMGLPFRTVLPELFESLRRLVGFSQGIFVEMGPDLYPRYQYGDWDVPGPKPIGEILYDEFLSTGRLVEVLRSRAEILALPTISRLGDLLSLNCDEYRKHDIYRLVARPAQLHHALYLKLADRNQGPLALMLLNRSPEDQDFRPEHLRRLKDLVPFLSRALSGHQEAQDTWVESRDQAIVVLDIQGRIQHISSSGAKLMQYALDRRQATARNWKPFKPEFHAGDILNTLVKRLRCLEGSESETQTHSLQWSNHWGRFEFRARRLEPVDQGEKSLIAVTAIRQVPLALKLATVLRRFPLSGREYSVCLHIALGRSFKEIAHILRLSQSTVVAHSQAIYEKLGITGRSELLTSLYRH